MEQKIEVELYRKYGLPPEEMDKFLKTYTPVPEILKGCKTCKAPTTQKFKRYTISTLEEYKWFHKVPTQVIYLTYDCLRCQTSNEFPEIRVRPERRSAGLLAKVFEDSGESPLAA